MRIPIAFIMLILAAAGAHAAETYIVRPSALSVVDTVAKLEAVLTAAPPTIMAKVDHGQNAEQAGMELGESVLLIFGAPKIGTPIMQANPLAGLDLPAKMLVYSQDGQTYIAYTNPEVFKERYGAEAAEAQIAQMAKALEGFAEAAAE